MRSGFSSHRSCTSHHEAKAGQSLKDQEVMIGPFDAFGLSGLENSFA